MCGRGCLSEREASRPDIPDATEVIAVRHRGELLGAIAVSVPAADPLTPEQERMLSELAVQAGLVLRNVGLTAELRARLEDLQRSRERLVAAQDEERRRIERNLSPSESDSTPEPPSTEP